MFHQRLEDLQRCLTADVDAISKEGRAAVREMAPLLLLVLELSPRSVRLEAWPERLPL